MNKHKITGVTIIGVLIAFSAMNISSDQFDVSVRTALAAKKSAPSPVKAILDRDSYFPTTEDLAPEEMRITSLRRAMPFQRQVQAAPSFLVELGNGDKFLFDIGTGAAERLSALQIPYDYLNKVFLGHLHADHMGDFRHSFTHCQWIHS